MPGATAFTRMPRFAYSSAKLRVTASRPPFVIIGTAAFTPAMGCSTRGGRDVDDASHCFPVEHLLDHQLGDKEEPLDVDRREGAQIVERESVKGLEKKMPALLTRASIPPNRDTAVSTILAAV